MTTSDQASIMPRTHGRIFRWKMSNRSVLWEIPTVCGLHRTFFIGFSDTQSLRAGYKIFRQQNPLSEIPIVCTQFRRTKFHACSKSSRRAALAIERHFSRLVIHVVRHCVLKIWNFWQHLCDHVYVCMQDRFEPTSFRKRSTVLLKNHIVCTRHNSSTEPPV